MKNFNVIIDDFYKKKYVDTDNVTYAINKKYSVKRSDFKGGKRPEKGFVMKNYTITNMKFDNLIRVLYNVIHFLNKTRDLSNRYITDYSNYRKITDYVILLQKTARIINKISECDETSATKCFTCVNEIKDLINRSNLL